MNSQVLLPAPKPYFSYAHVHQPSLLLHVPSPFNTSPHSFLTLPAVSAVTVHSKLFS